MHTLRLIPILASTVLCSLTLLTAADKADGFSKLPPGDALKMRFTSEGCFHFYTYDLTFTRNATATASVTLIMLEWVGTGDTYRDAERSELGKLPLSDTDLAGLDSLLAFYRTNSSAGCTTKDSIKISQIRNGKVIATEKFKDASCGADDIKGVLSIRSLVRRLPEKKE